MKCPKCSYVGFESSERCRHCGYDFALLPDMPRAAVAVPPVARPEPVPFPVVHQERPAPAAPAAALDDLPLPEAPAQSTGVVVDLFAEPPKARNPLAVRRATERARPRSTPHPTRRTRPALFVTADAAPAPPSSGDVAATPSAPAASPWSRVLSAGVDGLVLGAIDAAVVYLTAQIAGVPAAGLADLPRAPLITFVAGLNVAYLAVFTANGGQTLGKMVLGLRVEGTDRELTFGGALVRVVVAVAGALAAGAGFLPALWRADGRAVHDHVAHTRVVRVPA